MKEERRRPMGLEAMAERVVMAGQAATGSGWGRREEGQGRTGRGASEWMRLVDPAALLLLLGPSTPLTSALFPFGFDTLSGVRVDDIHAAASSIAAGQSFHRMAGLKRVTLLR